MIYFAIVNINGVHIHQVIRQHQLSESISVHYILSCNSWEEEYKSVIKRMAETTNTGKRRLTGSRSNPFSIASQLAGTRQPGEILDEQEYQRLPSMIVVETNTAFWMVEVLSFGNVMRYCNSQVPIVSRSMLYRDIYKLLYCRLFFF